MSEAEAGLAALLHAGDGPLVEQARGAEQQLAHAAPLGGLEALGELRVRNPEGAAGLGGALDHLVKLPY